jgi:tetratricopeptide (TPR) repeat protein
MSREAVDLFRAVGKFDPDEAESALRDLYRSICADEIDDFINRAFKQGKAGSARECFDRLCYLYPYFHPGQAERAVRLDEDGQTHAALNCMLKAIILEPREATRWHSLGVILKKLGRNDDAMLAYGLAKIVHTEEGKR